MPNLLEYLTWPNLVVDRAALEPGTNTLPIGTYELEGVQDWTDFTLERVLECFPDVLLQDVPDSELYYPAPVPEHHLKLTDESCVETIVKKHNHVIIDRALQIAQPLLQNRGLRLPISMSWGSLVYLQEDSRLRPDWAGTIHSGRPPYEIRVPGETKQSAKWRSSMKDNAKASVQDEYWKPLRQMLLCCIRANTRYGYIVTDAEALFFRRTRSQEPLEPLSTNRPRRHEQLAHNRVTSITSIVSGTSRMSLDSSGSPYTDGGNPDINEAPLEIAVVPWDNAGPTKLTVNLGIWFIHLLSAGAISVEESYRTLGSWQKIKDSNGHWQYCQEGSRRVAMTVPLGEIEE